MSGEHALKEPFSDATNAACPEATIICASKNLDRFAILVIQIDEFAKRVEELGELLAENISVRLSNILEGLGKTRDITTVRLNKARQAVLCPHLDEAGAVAFAEEIQRRFSLGFKETVSVGLAVHPFWPFEKDTILANAQKAIDHAAFFGSNTVTPFDAVSLNISADTIYQYGDIDGAIEEFKKALMIDAHDVNVHNSLGVCYGVQEKFDLAIESFQTALKLNPGDVMATYNLGLAHLKKGNRDQALSLFLSAFGLDGSHPEIACHIGLCYQEMGELEKAIDYFEKGEEKNPKNPHLYRALAECYKATGKLREACRAYSKAIKRYPADAKSLSGLGQVYGALGENLEIAIVLARESTLLESENATFKKRLGELYLQAGQPNKALEELEKAVALGESCDPLIQKAKAETAPTE